MLTYKELQSSFQSEIVFDSSKDNLINDLPRTLLPRLVSVDDNNLYCFIEFSLRETSEIASDLKKLFELKKKSFFTEYFRKLNNEGYKEFLDFDSVEPTFLLLKEDYGEKVALGLTNFFFDSRTQFNLWHMNRPRGKYDLGKDYLFKAVLFTKKEDAKILDSILEILEKKIFPDSKVIEKRETTNHSFFLINITEFYYLTNPALFLKK
jgi:hypothetical protein